jgi:IMP dehydrogenase/GMP reductase
VDLTTRLTRKLTLNIPLLSAAMDTVTEARLAIAIAQEGGVGIIHKNLSNEDQAAEVDRVKRSESGMILDPITLPPNRPISDALRLCGGRNVFDDLADAAPVVSREAVLQRAPELVVGGSDGPDPRPAWQRFTALAAVRNEAFVTVDADLLHRPAPRVLDGAQALCAALAPYVR